MANPLTQNRFLQSLGQGLIGFNKGLGMDIGLVDHLPGMNAVNSVISHPVIAARQGVGAAEQAAAPGHAAFQASIQPHGTAQRVGSWLGSSLLGLAAAPETKLGALMPVVDEAIDSGLPHAANVINNYTAKLEQRWGSNPLAAKLGGYAARLQNMK